MSLISFGSDGPGAFDFVQGDNSTTQYDLSFSWIPRMMMIYATCINPGIHFGRSSKVH